VIDCRLSSDERVNVLDTISKKYNVKVYKYSLIALYDALHSRVKQRDESRGNNLTKNALIIHSTLNNPSCSMVFQ